MGGGDTCKNLCLGYLGGGGDGEEVMRSAYIYD